MKIPQRASAKFPPIPDLNEADLRALRSVVAGHATRVYHNKGNFLRSADAGVSGQTLLRLDNLGLLCDDRNVTNHGSSRVVYTVQLSSLGEIAFAKNAKK